MHRIIITAAAPADLANARHIADHLRGPDGEVMRFDLTGTTDACNVVEDYNPVDTARLLEDYPDADTIIEVFDTRRVRDYPGGPVIETADFCLNRFCREAVA